MVVPGAGSDGSRPAESAVRISAHASGLHSVERELTSLHRQRLHRGQEDTRTVRLSMVTLIALCSDEPCAHLAEETVEVLYRTHPARAIVVISDERGEDRLDADLTLLCSPTPRGEICAEQVRLSVRGRPALHLASAITPLLVPDVPVYLWLVGTPSLEHVFRHEAPALDARLIIDSGSYPDPARTLDTIAAELERSHPPSLTDIAWARSRLWRERVAQAFDAATARPFVSSVTGIEIDCEGRSPSAQAWLTAGWLASRLRPTAGDIPVTVTAVPGQQGSDREGELSAVRLFARSAAHRAAIMLGRDAAHLDIRIHVDGGQVGRWTTPLLTADVRRLVGGLLDEETRADPVYLDALRWGARLAGSGPR